VLGDRWAHGELLDRHLPAYASASGHALIDRKFSGLSRGLMIGIGAALPGIPGEIEFAGHLPDY
jgi:hypothetical protein